MRRAALFLLLFLWAVMAQAQSSYDTSETAQTGAKVLGSYFATDIDSVSMTNGQLNVSIPVFNLAGRELPLHLSLDYNSRFFEKRYFYDPNNYYDPDTDTWYGNWVLAWYPNVWKVNTGLGGSLTATLTLTTSVPSQNPACVYYQCGIYRADFYWIETNGTKHKFTKENLPYYGWCTGCDPGYEDTSPGLGDNPNVVMNNLLLTSTESDFIRIYTLKYFYLSNGAAVIYLKNGTRIAYEKNYTGGTPAVPRTTLTTPNGNKLVIDANAYGGYLPATDTLGHAITASALGNTTTITLRDSNNQNQTYQWTTQGVTVAGNNYNTDPYVPETPLDTASGVHNSYTAFGMAVYSSVTLPNGKSYQFTYDTSRGLLTKITFPTGAYIRYTWIRAFNGNTQGPWQVATRIVSADGTAANEKTSTYSFTYSESYGPSPLGSPWPSLTQGIITSSTVTDPTGASVVHYFSNGLETRTEYRAAGDGRGLRIISKTWENPTNNARSTSIATLTDFASFPSITNYSYDTTNNVTSEVHYNPDGSVAASKNRTFTTIGYNLGVLTNETVVNGDGNIASKTDYAYDEYALTVRTGVPGHTGDTSNADRANPTTIKRYKNAAAFILEHLKYDSAGNVVEKDDPLNHATLIDFTDKFSDSINRNTFAFPTRTTDPSGFYVDTTYDFNTGLVKQSRDSLNRISTLTYDVMNRETAANYPNGGWTHYTYDDLTPATTKEVLVDGLGNTGTVKTTFDKLYRGILTETWDPDAAGHIFVQTQYDSRGRKWKVSNPYRSAETPVWTQFAYDALDRPTVTTAPDNSTVQYAYAATMSTVTDEAGNQRRYTYDGLGRMTKVEEPNPTLSTPLVTTYVYNGLGKLTQSNQSNQTRTFVFDWLGRMTSQTLPESGQTTFTYSDDGQLLTKTDARGITTTMAYGASGGSIHQVISRSYSDSTPAVSFTYSSQGLSSTMTDGLGTVAYTYDPNTDKLTQESRTLTGITGTFTTGYGYDIKGNLKSMTYPSGRVVNFNYAAGGGCCNSRLASVVDQTTNTTLNSAMTFNAAGEITANTLGNGLAQTYTYNNRLQQTGITAALTGTTLMNLAYDYGTSTTNTGRVLSRSDSVQQEHSAKYLYDSIYRLGQAVSSDASWGILWTFDVWGNRLTQTPQGLATTKIGTQTLGYTNNRLTGITNLTYDNAGNLTNEGTGGHYYAYDANNKITSVDGGAATYMYDGNGLRVKKTVGSVSTFYFYADGMGLISEFSTDTSISNATAASSSDRTRYRTSDNLGSAVLLIDSSGLVIENNRTLPYGETWSSSTGSMNDQKFTSYLRDPESGLDYAMARYYASSYGRFLSADPGSRNAKLEFPQTLNAYTYLENDPINGTDPTGEFSLKKLFKVIKIVAAVVAAIVAPPAGAALLATTAATSATAATIAGLIAAGAAVGEELAEQRGLPRPAYLQVTEDCYDRAMTLASGMPARRRTYELHDEQGHSLTGPADFREINKFSGATVGAYCSTWYGGIGTDTLQGRADAIVQQVQSFQAKTRFYNDTSSWVSVFVRELDGRTDHGELGIFMSRDGVFINGDRNYVKGEDGVERPNWCKN